MKAVLHAALLLGALPLPAYELHEWGTFTTVSGSDGALLTGLEREEEALPAYVHHHPGFAQPRLPNQNLLSFLKRVPLPVKQVKVKMETPVIYFHSEKAFPAKVSVDFKGGTISQWYPQRQGGETFPRIHPETGERLPMLDFSEPYTGSISWDVEILSPTESRASSLFRPDDLLQWTYARIPEANLVRDPDGQTEGFLFYRGLGSFDPGLTTRISPDETLHLENRTGGRIPYTLVFERLNDGSSRWFEAGGLDSGSTSSIAESSLRSRPAGFDAELFRTLRSKLAAQGLLASEAEAMVKTWWKSYFDTPGLRVFWVLPPEKTDAILPLTVEPEPADIVRVLVGRSEVLRPRQETEWTRWAQSDDGTETVRWHQLVASDRFGQAYAERIASLQAQAKRRAKPQPRRIVDPLKRTVIR